MVAANELDLIHSSQKGDMNAFNHLVIAYQEMAFNLAARILSDDDTAEDITQMAFISAFRNIGQYHGGSFRAWVLRIVTNCCYDELRRHKRHPTIPLEPVVEKNDEEIESPIWLKDNQPSPEDSFDQAELDHAIQHCLQNLPEEFRTIVVLVEMQGLDYQEAARVVNKPEGTIKSRLARARLKLRNCLQKFQELLPVQFRLNGEENR